MPTIYLIDGMSLVFRAYHALSRSGLKSPSGEPTYAVFAFANILTSLLEKEKPDYLSVVFDRSEPTFRHIKYPLYKANRAAFPEDLVPQLKRIKELIDYLSISRIELPGFEADDIIGTISHKTELKESKIICMTNDKDYYQLVSDNVVLYKPSKTEDFEVVSFNEVKNKFGVMPNQVIDVLALIGDSSDNIPGVKGVGEKTAIPLIQKYHTIEQLYQNIDEISPLGLKEKLITDKDNAFLAKYLVTIDKNVPIDFSLENLKIKEPDYKKLDSLFSQLNFNTLRKKWGEKSLKSISFPEKNDNRITDKIEIVERIETNVISINEFPVSNDTEIKTIEDLESDYHLINTNDSFQKLIKELETASVISVDLETSSLDKNTCEIVGIALCSKANRAFFVAVYSDTDEFLPPMEIHTENSLFGDSITLSNPIKPKDSIDNKDKLPVSFVIKSLKPLLENKSIKKVGQNIKFDAYILMRYGINISPITFDTMIASYLLNPDTKHNLDYLSQHWLKYSPISITSLIGEKKSNQISMKDLPPSKIYDYACEDADLAFKLREILYHELKRENLLTLAKHTEFPLIEVLTKMEFNGVAININALQEISKKIGIEANLLTEKIYNEAGTIFNIDSPKQLGEILFDRMHIPVMKKTKTGYSTDVETMSQLADSYPIAQHILEYRQLTKLKSTYLDALPKLINPKTGKIHTTFNQTIASTGRLSSTDPNLQNIPIRSALGKEVRKAFVPYNPDNFILSADYSQVELRIMAFICQDKNLINSFKKGLDIHSATASILFDTPLEKVTGDMRRTAKTVNFGIMYGLGSFGLSQRLKISKKEAQEIINNYFRKYPGIKNYIDNTIKETATNGYAKSLLGRRRYFTDITNKNSNIRSAAERAAINMPIQGTASDMIKKAMIDIDSEMVRLNLKSLMTIQVHDEIVFEAIPSEIDILKEIITTKMENAINLGDVPVIAEIGIGKNWFEAH